MCVRRSLLFAQLNRLRSSILFSQWNAFACSLYVHSTASFHSIRPYDDSHTATRTTFFVGSHLIVTRGLFVGMQKGCSIPTEKGDERTEMEMQDKCRSRWSIVVVCSSMLELAVSVCNWIIPFTWTRWTRTAARVSSSPVIIILRCSRSIVIEPISSRTPGFALCEWRPNIIKSYLQVSTGEKVGRKKRPKYLRPIVPLRQISVNLSIKLFHIIYSHTLRTQPVSTAATLNHFNNHKGDAEMCLSRNPQRNARRTHAHSLGKIKKTKRM